MVDFESDAGCFYFADRAIRARVPEISSQILLVIGIVEAGQDEGADYQLAAMCFYFRHSDKALPPPMTAMPLWFTVRGYQAIKILYGVLKAAGRVLVGSYNDFKRVQTFPVAGIFNLVN